RGSRGVKGLEGLRLDSGWRSHVPRPGDDRLRQRDDRRARPDGTFRTPREIYRKGREFRVEAPAEGFVAGSSDWISTEGRGLLTIADLVLRALLATRPVSGRVIDRVGKGVAGASVFQEIGAIRGKATTDGDGRFRLAEVPGSTALVFAEKSGF